MDRAKRLAVFIALAGLAAGLYFGTRGHQVLPAKVVARATTTSAPRLQAVDLEGRSIDTASYAGKVVLVNFWAAWCTSCADEIPQFVSLQDKFGSQGFQAIGISMEDKESALRRFYRQYKMNYPVIVGNQQLAQEYGGILGLPTTIVIGREGRIHSKHSGLADVPKLQLEIQELLQAGK
ncbi:MAG: TlpA family protein disulfide reductase [Terriglobales bacterium]